jgi:hypothetical protein
MNWPLKIQGRFLSESMVNELCELMKRKPDWNRTRLSRELCEIWNWRRPDGQIKDMACRELLRKLDSRSLIKLPPRQRPGPGRLPVHEPVIVNKKPLNCRLSDIQPVKIINARNSVSNEKTFNYFVNEYHYLGYGRPVGQNMKYLISGLNDRILGCVLFGAAAWKSADRDQWIGWSPETREHNLSYICNNTRFLIFPWVNVFNLASYVLATVLRRLSEDWFQRYGTNIVLVETFVDKTRFIGTCYKASNWRKIGQTKGRSRQDRYKKLNVPIKDIWVFPLQNNFRDVLVKIDNS